MAITLTQPSIGSTNWGSSVNTNWQTLADSLNGNNSDLQTLGFLTFAGVSAPGSPAVGTGQGVIYFDSTSNKFLVSENNGSFVNLTGPLTSMQLLAWTSGGASASIDTIISRSAAGVLNFVSGSSVSDASTFLRVGASSISAFSAASSTAGTGYFARVQDGGSVSSGAGVAGAGLNYTLGAGSNGASGNNNGGAAGQFAITAAAGGNATGSGTGGDGGGMTLNLGAGGTGGTAGQTDYSRSWQHQMLPLVRHF